MILTLDSDDVERDDLFTAQVFLDDISLRELIVFKRMIDTEFDRRANIMDRRIPWAH